MEGVGSALNAGAMKTINVVRLMLFERPSTLRITSTAQNGVQRIRLQRNVSQAGHSGKKEEVDEA